jgi:hypothetical protein
MYTCVNHVQYNVVYNELMAYYIHLLLYCIFSYCENMCYLWQMENSCIY